MSGLMLSRVSQPNRQRPQRCAVIFFRIILPYPLDFGGVSSSSLKKREDTMNGDRSVPSSSIDPAGGAASIGSEKRKNQSSTSCAGMPPASPDTSVTMGSSSSGSTAPTPPPMQCLHEPNITTNNTQTAQKLSAGLPIPKSVDEYRTLLRRNATFVHLAEDVLSRLLLYAPSRLAHADDDETLSGLSIGSALLNAKSLYALLNLWQLTNDVVLHGPGDGTGMTVGTAQEAAAGFGVASDSNQDAAKAAESSLRRDWGEVSTLDSEISLRSVLAKILPRCVADVTSAADPARLLLGLRAVLSVVECIAPAMEVLSGIPSRPRGAAGFVPLHVQQQRRASAELSKMTTLTRLERIKFTCRLCLLLTNAVNAYRRICDDERVDGQSVMVAAVFRHGGMLHPGERAVPAAEEEERLRRVGYVGRRTGRRTHPGGTPMNHQSASRMAGIGGAGGRGGVKDLANAGAKTRLAALTAGELLHIYRPLYWTASERDHAAHSLHMHQLGGLSHTRSSSERLTMLKSWVVGLAMDVMSHRLTMAATSGGRPTNIPFRGHFDTSSSVHMPPATAKELQRRKMRWMLYLLRCPVWDVLTRPVAGGLADFIGRFVPLLGRPFASYVMDLLIYWQRHHFMLEG